MKKLLFFATVIGNLAFASDINNLALELSDISSNFHKLKTFEERSNSIVTYNQTLNLLVSKSLTAYFEGTLEASQAAIMLSNFYTEQAKMMSRSRHDKDAELFYDTGNSLVAGTHYAINNILLYELMYISKNKNKVQNYIKKELNRLHTYEQSPMYFDQFCNVFLVAFDRLEPADLNRALFRRAERFFENMQDINFYTDPLRNAFFEYKKVAHLHPGNWSEAKQAQFEAWLVQRRTQPHSFVPDDSQETKEILEANWERFLDKILVK